MMKNLLRILFLAGTLLPLCGCGSMAAHSGIWSGDVRPCPYPGVLMSSMFVRESIRSIPETHVLGAWGVAVGVADIAFSAVADTVFLPADIGLAAVFNGERPEDATWLSGERLNPESIVLDGNLLKFRFATDRGPWFPGKYVLKFEHKLGTALIGEGGISSKTHARNVYVLKESTEIYLREREAFWQVIHDSPSVCVDVGENYIGRASEKVRERVAKVELVFELSEDFRGSFTFGKSTLFVDRSSETPIKFGSAE